MNEYRRLSRKQWAWTTATAFLLAFAVGGFAYVYYWPQYEADASLLVPTAAASSASTTINVPNCEAVTSEQISSEKIRDILASPGTARDMLTQMGVLVNLRQRDWSAADLESALRDCDAIEESSRQLDVPPAALRQRIGFRGLGDSQMILVSYTSCEREIPARVVNSVVQSVIEEEMRERREAKRRRRERVGQVSTVCCQELRQLHVRIQSHQLYRDEMERLGVDPAESEALAAMREQLKRYAEVSRVVENIRYRLDADHGPSPPFRWIQRAATPPPKPSRSEVIPLVSLTAFCVPFVFLGIMALWQNWRRGWRQQFGLKALLLLALFVAVAMFWNRLGVQYGQWW